jgi:hypothetical protein
MVRGERCHLAYLGPSFFTKWLYFTGWNSRVEETARPLILDRFVALAISEVAASEWSENGPWSFNQYRDYIEAARGVEQCSPDAAELALFERGRTLYRQRKSQ